MAKRALTTGFLKISHEKLIQQKLNNIGILERQTLWKNGRKLLDAKHLYDVTEVQEPGKPIRITGKCVRSCSVNEKWSVEVELGENRIISSAHCSCWIGEFGDCKHTAALILFVNEYR